MPETTDPDDCDPIRRPHTVLQDRREHGGAGAPQRPRILRLDLVRQRKGELHPLQLPRLVEPEIVSIDVAEHHTDPQGGDLDLDVDPDVL